MTEHTDVWVCVDCYFAHHYGYHAGDRNDWLVGPDFDYPKDATENEPLHLLGDVELADNTCSNHNGYTHYFIDDENAEHPCSECGRADDEDGMQAFSWSRCQGCGSMLGGARYRLAIFAKGHRVYRVTETIHHGQYYNVQTSDGDTIVAAFREALRTSPYNFTATTESNSYVRDCLQDLILRRSGDFGWARYTVEELP